MLEQQLRELALRADSQGPFLSLYVNTNRSDEQGRDRIRVWMKDETRRIREEMGSDGQPDVEKAVGLIQSYIEESLRPGTRGLAVFACPSEDLFLPLQLPVPVEPQLRIGSRPHLRPLMKLRQRYPLVLVAVIDNKSARLFEMEFGRVLFELDLENPDVPRRHDQGGWSQANYQRHVQNHVDRHHKEIAERLSRLIDLGRVKAVVLSGQERNVANFRGFLPKRVEELVAGILHLDIHSTAEEITRSAQELNRAAFENQIAARLELVEEAARKNGRGALGVAALADAVNQRKLETLFVSEHAQAHGWKCSQCGTLGQQVPLGCPICSAPVVTVDLIEEFVSAAGREDAKLEFVPPGSPLDRYEGVAAATRF